MSPVGRGVFLLKFFCQFGSHWMADLAPKGLDKQASAHSDAAMDTPHSKRKAHLLESFMPRQYMLVNAVNQRAVQVEKERGHGRIMRSIRRHLTTLHTGPFGHTVYLDSTPRPVDLCTC